MTALPNYATTLLALDVSNNFFNALPTTLSTLLVLEELNVSGNPIRAIPVFLTTLSRSLRILLADNCGLSTMPVEMTCMKRLTVLSLRRNKLHNVPDCIAGMASLEDLRLDGNQFLGPWKELTAPLMESYGSPISPLPSEVHTPAQSSSGSLAFSDEGSPPAHEEDHTIRASLHAQAHEPQSLQRSFTAPLNGSFIKELGVISPPPNNQSLLRTRTMPRQHSSSRTPTPDNRHHTRSQYQVSSPSEEQKEHSIRRMRSANELRGIQINSQMAMPPGARVPQARQHAQSVSVTHSMNHMERPGSARDPSKKFGSIGRALGSSVSMASFGDTSSSVPMASPARMPYPPPSSSSSSYREARDTDDRPDSKGKWGFFKKMSMRSLKTPEGLPVSRHRERPALPQAAFSTPNIPRVVDAAVQHQTSFSSETSRATTPLPIPPSPNPPYSSYTDDPGKTPLPLLSPTATLSPSPTTAPTAKRRSFLPIDLPPSIHIPPPSPSIGLMVPTSGAVDSGLKRSESQLSLNTEEIERQRLERKTRAIRTLFAYLQDMLDLGVPALSLSQSQGGFPQSTTQLPSSPPTSLPPDHTSTGTVRSRRPTLSDVMSGVMSDPSFTTASSLSASQSSMNLRDLESSNSSMTSPTPSTPSENPPPQEDRKSKDDKSKRANCIREIVE
jgi:hypothetical protein